MLFKPSNSLYKRWAIAMPLTKANDGLLNDDLTKLQAFHLKNIQQSYKLKLFVGFIVLLGRRRMNWEKCI
jgi:hypothetical protein